MKFIEKTSISTIDKLIIVGRIHSAHGLSGELRIHSFTSPVTNIISYKKLMLNVPHQDKLCVHITKYKFIEKRSLLVKIQGVNDRTTAESLLGYEICLCSNLLPELAMGDFYWHELIGLNVIDKQRNLLGRIKNLLETGSNDVIHICPVQGSIDNRERLLPYTEQCMVAIDLKAREMRVDWDKDF